MGSVPQAKWKCLTGYDQERRHLLKSYTVCMVRDFSRFAAEIASNSFRIPNMFTRHAVPGTGDPPGEPKPAKKSCTCCSLTIDNRLTGGK
jgi:hypothetical protein